MTTTTGEQLLRAICLHPEDDDRRLVYTDWLEDNDQQERAEFIRLQVRIAALERTCGCGRCVRKRGGGQCHNGPCAVDQEREELADGRSRQAFLRQRERELRESSAVICYLTDLPFNAELPRNAIRRGFVEAIKCDCDTWLQHGSAVVLAHPIMELELTEAMHLQYGSALQQQMLADGIPVQLPQNEAALTWARRKAGLEVRCSECGGTGSQTVYDIGGSIVGNQSCDDCYGDGWRTADD